MMKKLITTISRFALNLLLPFLAIGFGGEVWRLVQSIAITAPRPSAFLLGTAVFIPVWFVGRRLMPRVVSYLTTLEHELTHILVGLLFLIRPVLIEACANKSSLITDT